MGHRVKIIKNFVDPIDAEKMMRLIDAGPRIPFVDNYNPSISVLSEDNLESEEMLKKYSDKVIELHKEEFGWVRPLYTTQCHASLWVAGAEAGGHIDSHGGSEHIIFSSVIYLGGQFTGGDIVFPNHDVRYAPEPLSVAIFPSGGHEYLHGVDLVTSGKRYTMPMWHTGDRSMGLAQLYSNKGKTRQAEIWSDIRIKKVVVHNGFCEV